jgi:hypothetical protein
VRATLEIGLNILSCWRRQSVEQFWAKEQYHFRIGIAIWDDWPSECGIETRLEPGGSCLDNQ